MADEKSDVDTLVDSDETVLLEAEDPEQCIGKMIKDPWNDDAQEDWPAADLEQEVAE